LRNKPDSHGKEYLVVGAERGMSSRWVADLM